MCTLVAFVITITIRIIIVSMAPPAVLCRMHVDVVDLACGVHIRHRSTVRTMTSLATILAVVIIASMGAILMVSP
jgi:hypothetical protein